MMMVRSATLLPQPPPAPLPVREGRRARLGRSLPLPPLQTELPLLPNRTAQRQSVPCTSNSEIELGGEKGRGEKCVLDFLERERRVVWPC